MTARLVSLDPDLIEVGDRHRVELGDLSELADSIRTVGLLHPIVVDPGYRLIAGERRLRAWTVANPGTPIPAHVVDSLDDALALRAENDENVCRKDFTPIEAKAMRDALLALEKPKAKERQAHGTTAPGKPKPHAVGNLPEASDDNRAKERASKATGFSRRTLDKVDTVVAAAEDPEMPEPVRKVAAAQVSALAKHGAKVDAAYREVEKAKDAAFSRKVDEITEGSPRVRTANANAALAKVSSAIAHFLVHDAAFIAAYADQRDLDGVVAESSRLAQFIEDVKSKRQLRAVN
jgi:ParB family chromosome partitioning protein